MPQRPDWAEDTKTHAKERLADLAVAFVEFKINGTVAERLHYLRPRETHDLDIAVRVSRWPEGATSLVLSPLSIEPDSTYDLPVFAFDRPETEPPFLFQQRGRMVLHVPHNLHARPFEFMYTRLKDLRAQSTDDPYCVQLLDILGAVEKDAVFDRSFRPCDPPVTPSDDASGAFKLRQF